MTEELIFATRSLPWDKYYLPGASQRVLGFDTGRTLWNTVEDAMRTDGPDVTAIEYFGRSYSRPQFAGLVHSWARVFKGMGIRPDERVVLFSPFTPHIAAMIFALNEVGAAALMPNIGASSEAIAQSVADARYAICLDALYDKLAMALEKPQFRQVIIVSAGGGMPPLSGMVAGLAGLKKHIEVMRCSKGRFITAARALRKYGSWQGNIEEPYVKDRVAIITSSGGTTIDGHAKLIQITNESILFMLASALESRKRYGYFNVGDRTFSIMPPFVSTSFFVFLVAPLFSGGTVIMEPRLSAGRFADSLLKFRPQISVMTGKGWEAYFRKIDKLVQSGKTPDLSHWKMLMIGGEGCTPQELAAWNATLKKCGAGCSMMPGYGMSEGLAVMTVDFDRYDCSLNSRDCIHVGRPFAGMVLAVHDSQGCELPAGTRGELWVKTPTMMKGYLGTPDQNDTVIRDGWIHTGDLFEMDDCGEFFCYGRMSDNVTAPDGTLVYTFDIASKLRSDRDVRLALVIDMSHGNNTEPQLVAHLVLEPGCTTAALELVERLDANMAGRLPEGLFIKGYNILKEDTFLTSAVMKTDKNHYKKIKTGYLTARDGRLANVDFQ